ncbi:MAG: hypothetical protein KDA42_14545, partial [Planctomycetales bacterium]|nr:hypothetical protein [Planctomycetales bacterium]
LSTAAGLGPGGPAADGEVEDYAVTIAAVPVPGTLSIAAADAVKAEGNAGTTSFTFTVSRTGGSDGAVGASWDVIGITGDPADAADFGGSFPSASVSFADGDAADKTVTVLVSGDTTAEADEGFRVVLSGPTGGASLGTATADGTIEDDDTVAASVDPVVTGTALSGAAQVALSWVPDPTDMTTRVVRKTGSYPTSETDGTLVYEGAGTSVVDDDGGGGLAAGTYYYSFFATNGLGSYSVATNAGAEGTVVNASGLAPSLAATSVRSIDMLAFADTDKDGTLRAAEASGALEVDVLGAATNGEDDTLTADLDSPISGSFTFETLVTTPALMNQDWNLQLSLSDGGAPAIDFAFRFRYLFARVDGGAWNQVASSLAAGTQYKLSVVVDTTSGDVEVFWDEDKRQTLSTALTQVSQLALVNLGRAASDVQYTLDDARFITGTPGFYVAPVTTPGVSAGDLNSNIVLGSSARTFSSVSLVDPDEDGTMQGSIASGELDLALAGSAASGENDAILATLDSSISGTFTFETEFTTPTAVNQEWSLELGLEDGSGNEIRLAFRYRYLFLRDGGSWRAVKSLLNPSTTYKLSVVVDTSGGTADYYIDDTLTAQAGVSTALTNLSQLRFTNIGNASADLNYQIDNLRVVAGDVFNPPPPVALGAAVLAANDRNTSDSADEAPGASAVAIVARQRAGASAVIDELDLLAGEPSHANARSIDRDAASSDQQSGYETLADEVFASLGEST